MAEQHRAHVDLLAHQRRHERDGEAGDGVDLPGDQQTVPYIGVDGAELDRLEIEPGLLRKQWQERVFARGDGASHLLADEILRRLDRAVLQHADAHGGVVAGTGDRDHRQTLGGLLDAGRRSGGAELELPGADRLCGGDRAVAARDLHIEPELVPVALGLGDEHEGIRAFREPRQGERDLATVLRVRTSAQDGGRGRERAQYHFATRDGRHGRFRSDFGSRYSRRLKRLQAACQRSREFVSLSPRHARARPAHLA